MLVEIKRVSILLILFIFQAILCLGQNDEGFIYGKITTLSGAEYKGQIRWGKEEAFWNDIFNSIKSPNSESTYSKYAPEKDSKDWWDNIDGKILKIWDDTYSKQLHQFTCRFGDIKSITPHANGKTICEIKNGVKINLQGGSNDIGETILIYDFELGKINMKWSKIKKIEFEDTPKVIEERIGNPIYGKVNTLDGEFTGFVQWDMDERLDCDLIQGTSGSGKAEIPFSSINSITNLGDKSQLMLAGGKELILSGTNDVNSKNRGIIVSDDGTGKIEIPWKAFKNFHKEASSSSGLPYSSYPIPQRLHGEVKDLDGNSFEGLIIFDKDEKWDFEHLEGNYKNLKYNIPFRAIRTIIPKNESYSYVILKNEQKLILGKLQDVSSKNEGVVVILPDQNTPTFIDWEQVDEIHFD